MSAPNSLEELLALIRKSGMVDESRLTGWINRRSLGHGLTDDPREAADQMVQGGVITNFQAEQFLLGKWRGFTIGKFKLLERVGVGGMGQVFLCEHMFMKRRVAVKVLPPAKAEHPAALGRFYREARAAGLLEHANIVRTHDIDQDGNLHFIVMEYVDGANLLEIVRKFGPMEIGRAVHYVRQVAMGLEFAFKNGIIHRDVKPGNILIDRRGTAKILDMGLARFFKDQSDNLTVKYDDKIVLGTADYVAPEQVANSHNVDVRADVYALGATLYFLLAGHPPFPTGTSSQKLIWHRTKDPTPIREIRPEVPAELGAIVMRMMAKDPLNRLQTPGEVADALTPFVPAKVGPPPVEEMPVLCTAAQDKTSASDTVSDTAQAATAESEVPVLVAAAGGARGSRPHLMEQRGGTAIPVKPVAAVMSPFGSPPVGSGPALLDRRLPHPFDAVSSRPQMPAITPMPEPVRSLPRNGVRPSSVLMMPPVSPFLEEPTSSYAARRSTAAAIALLAACLALAGGIAIWKSSPAAPDAVPETVKPVQKE